MPDETNVNDRVGFCQDCGKPLTAETIRQVGSGVFCEPCLENRIAGGAAPGARAGYAAGTPPGFPPAYPPPTPGVPHPFLAGLLGIIPGVGPVYNGQYAKGLVHFVIFAVLESLSKNVSGAFHLFVLVWICYGSYEAYQTAKARLHGLPLPDMFGFNNIGDRMGFGKNWPGSASRPTAPYTPPYTPAAAQAAPPPPSAWTPPPPAPPVATNDWTGYVPPTAFTDVPPVVTPNEANWGSTPHQAAYTNPYAPIEPAIIPPTPKHRFPVGAIWLIALGVLFLLANFGLAVHVDGLWLTAGILGAFSIWSIISRVHALDPEARHKYEGGHFTAELLCVVRWPVILLVLAVLFALQAADIMTLGQSWPVLLLVFGAMLLLERSLNLAAPVAPPYYPPAPPADDAAKGDRQ